MYEVIAVATFLIFLILILYYWYYIKFKNEEIVTKREQIIPIFVDEDNRLVFANVENRIERGTFKSIIKWSYHASDHKAEYTIPSVEGIWSEIRRGYILVTNNNDEHIYIYKSRYCPKKNKLYFSINKSNGKPLNLEGDIRITMIISHDHSETYECYYCQDTGNLLNKKILDPRGNYICR